MTKGTIPSGRYQHGSAVIEHNLYIFGGIGIGATFDNTLYYLNTLTNQWAAITIAESSDSLPQPR